jgi:CRP-like cAMP-binding protein
MTFDLAGFLATAGVGRRIVQLKPKQAFFSQGSSADSIFYLQTGRAKLTVVSQDGKEATIALLAAGEFIGEESLASVGGLHMHDQFPERNPERPPGSATPRVRSKAAKQAR